MLANLKNIVVKRMRDSEYCLDIRSFTLHEEEKIAITGPSGCGKSTTLDLLSMVLRPTAIGEFSFNFNGSAYDVKSLWERGHTDMMANLRKDYMGYVLQTGELIPFLNVMENILLTAKMGGEKPDYDYIESLIETLGISYLLNAMPAMISVGERQRVAIARALASKPRLLLADEPTASLDPILSKNVMQMFLDTAERAKTTVVMVSHDVSLVREFGFLEVPVSVVPNEKGVTSILDDSALRQSKRSFI